MSGGIEHLVLTGPLILAAPIALAAGAITFLSPCCLPLVPGYLSYVTGMSGADAQQAATAQAPAAQPAAARAATARAAHGTQATVATASAATATAPSGCPACVKPGRC